MGLYGFVTEQLPVRRRLAYSRWAVAAVTSRALSLSLDMKWWRSTPTRRRVSSSAPPRWRSSPIPEPFDAVVASLALHHVADLPGALDKIVSLLRPAGRLIVNEHAVDRLDEPTARWYLEKRAEIGPDAPRSLEQCLHEWEEDHAGLHGYAAMRQELDRRFTERLFAWMPYLYGELTGAVSDPEERALIEAGAIQATGLRYVGERQLTEPGSHQRPSVPGRAA